MRLNDTQAPNKQRKPCSSLCAWNLDPIFGQLAINRHYSHNSRIGPVTWRIVLNSETIREVSNQPARSWLTGKPEVDRDEGLSSWITSV